MASTDGSKGRWLVTAYKYQLWKAGYDPADKLQINFRLPKSSKSHSSGGVQED